MKRKKEGEPWCGKISYQNQEEVIEDPADVGKKIEEGSFSESPVALSL